jgi:hypothetical protein
MRKIILTLAITLLSILSGNLYAMQVFVKIIPSGKMITLELETSDGVENIKQQIQEREGLLPENQSIYFDGKKLEDGRTISDYNISKSSVLILVNPTKKSLLSVAPGSSFNVKAGTIVAAEKLDLKPSSDYSLTSSLEVSYGVTNNVKENSLSYFYRDYIFQTIPLAFSGDLTFGYNDYDLAYTNTNTLKLLYNSGNTSPWKLDNSSINNTSSKSVSATFTDEILREITLGACQTTQSSTELTACGSVVWNNVNYTQSGVYSFQTKTKFGCDSIAILNLTINPVKTGTDIKTACTSYTWIDGKTYTASNTTATHKLVAKSGCDSIVTLNLTINPVKTGISKQTACTSYTWIDGKTYTASNNSATHKLVAKNGCDSIVTLNLTINSVKTGTDVKTACTTFTWIDGKTYTASNTTATHKLVAKNGCDSIVTLNLTIQPIGTLTLFSAGGSNTQVKCNKTAITPIVYTTSTGTTNATVTGLPAGVTGVWAAGKFTISGTPTETGVFNYTVTAVGTCATAMGKITVNQNTMLLTSAVNSDKQTLCINTLSSNIIYSTLGATGATFTGLPLGVSGYFGSSLSNPNSKTQVNIGGTPSVAGTYSYKVTLTGGCGVTTATGVYVVNPKNTIVLTSVAATALQTKCINTPITDIIYTTATATGATVSGLPAGVTGSWLANKFTITGKPTVAGIFKYTVTTIGGCSVATATGTINSTINAIALSSALGTDAQTKCIGTTITPITYTTSIATGASVSGLPAGVSGVWGANKLTISGTPTAAGTFKYTITLIGGCEIITKTGILVVSPNNTVTLSSGLNSNVKEVCVGATLANITYTTKGATGATYTGLPAGVTGGYKSDTITLKGIPTAAGVYPYTVTATGGCSIVIMKGTITVNAINTIALSSAAGTDKQIICTNGAIVNIGYKTTGATGITVADLPAGLMQSASAGVVTISGKPTAPGTYKITASGKCPSVVASGTITITPLNKITLTVGDTNVKEVCVNADFSGIRYNSTGATGATFAGLPAGVTGKFVSNVITLAGKPTTKGVYAYTVTGTGGCPGLTAKGTITVNELNAITLTSVAATTNQTVCKGSPITQIGYKITGASSFQVSTLPGLSQTNTAGVITISGTPSASVDYSITANGKCPSVTVLGKITVNPANTITLEPTSASNVQNICAKSAIGNILYKTTGATNATFTGLPLGVKGTWVNNLVRLSGNPYVAGTSNYTVTLTGGCKVVTAIGSIKVGVENKLTLTSAVGTTMQTVKVGTKMANITYTTAGATSVTIDPATLPSGVSQLWTNNILTISGTPSAVSAGKTFNYDIKLTGACAPLTVAGKIIVAAIGTALRPVFESNIELTSYPNPFSTSFRMNLVSQSEEPIALQVTDMVGRIVENHVINSFELSEKEIGEAYPVGVYNIVLIQGSEKTTLRVVKQ